VKPMTTLRESGDTLLRVALTGVVLTLSRGAEGPYTLVVVLLVIAWIWVWGR